MKILVTGGAGYIGSHTIIELLNAGYQVVSVDDESNAKPGVEERIEKITEKKINYYKGDIRDIKFLKSVWQTEKKIDGLIHFAALKSVDESLVKPLDYFDVNVKGWINVLKIASENGTKHILFSSSCTVYGNPELLPVKESTPLGIPESPYGLTKQIGENILEQSCIEKSELKGVSLRYFNPAGAHHSGLIGEDSKKPSVNLIPVLMESVLGKRSGVTVFGTDYNTRDGSCVRDYIHVVDLARGHVKTIAYMLESMVGNYDVFNLGDGKGISVLEAIQATERVTHIKVNKSLGERRPGDVGSIYANTSKSKQILKWNTQLSIEDIMHSAYQVDDGKSTLIGRLLYDSKSIYEDQYEQVKATTKKRGEEGVNLALLTDGLKSEREQGITIDVAYRYFSTPKRKFIIADTPGHIQYTRNMVTGASTANVALVIVDARNGVVEQTRRHSIISSLLQIPHLVFCINKMDLVDYEEERYEQIKEELESFAGKLDVKDVHFIPMSALNGDNVVEKSEHMPWYGGGTLLYYLENVHIGSDYNLIDSRFPVQFVVRPNTDEFHDYRGYAGRVAGGSFKKGDDVKLLPSGFMTKIAKIDTFDGEQEEAYPPMSVTLLLEDDLDLSRGDMIVRPNNTADSTQDIEAMICWFNEKPAQMNGKYGIMHTSNTARCILKDIQYKLDINTLHRNLEDRSLGLNDIGRIKIRTTKPLFVDAYRRNRITGSFILIDEGTNATVAAGMII